MSKIVNFCIFAKMNLFRATGAFPFKADTLKNIWKNQVHNMHGKG